MQDEIILGGEKKKKFSWRIFGIIMTVLTVFALVFGVVVIFVKNDEIARVKAEYGVSSGESNPGQSEDKQGNPVVKAAPPASYILSEFSPVFEASEGNFVYLDIKVKDGAIIGCNVKAASNAGSYVVGECRIDGVEGQIYKVVELSYSNAEKAGDALGLIMTDGSVTYVPLSGVEGKVFNAKGKLAIDGVVVDALKAEIKPNEYLEESYYETVFVLKSGEILKYDLTMAESV